MYKKRIKKDGKTYSYYYHNVKDKGRVKNIFLGDNKEEAFKKLKVIKEERVHNILLNNAPSPPGSQSSFPSIDYKLINLVIILFILVVGALLFYPYEHKTTFVVYEPNVIALNVNNLVSQNATVYINVNAQEYSKSINEFGLSLTNDKYEISILNIDITKFNINLDSGTYTVVASLIDNVNGSNELIAIASQDINVVGNLTKNETIKKVLPTETVTGEVKIDKKVENELLSKEKVRVILKKKQDVNKNEAEDFIKNKAKLTLKQNVDNLYAVEIGRNELDKLKKSKEIDEIVLDEQVSLFIQESIPLINIDKVKAQGYTGSGKSVCILDTGINYNLFGLELGNNVFGYDFVNNDNDPLDDHGHGTSVSNIVLQVAPDSRIYAAKVINNNGIGYYSDVLAGLQYCIDNNVDVISFSIGAGLSNGYCDNDLIASKVNSAVDSGIFSVASTGNDGSSSSIRVPSCASKATRVASSSKQDSISSFSNTFLNDLLTPGEDINTVDLNGNNVVVSGTSFSAPFVSGGALLILENRTLLPSELKYLLRSTSEIINYNNIPYNRLNLWNALINNKTNEPYNYSVNQTNISGGDFGLLAAPHSQPYLNTTLATNKTGASLTLFNISTKDQDSGTVVNSFKLYRNCGSGGNCVLNASRIFRSDNGLQLYLPFDYGNVSDFSPNKNDGVRPSVGTTVNNTNGRINNVGIGFESATVNVSNSASLQITGDLTIEAWIYHKESAEATIVTQECFTCLPDPNLAYKFYLDASNSLNFKHSESITPSSETITGEIFVSPNAWHHVAVTRDGSNIIFYVDGVSQSFSQTVSPQDSGEKIRIGGYGIGQTSQFRGMIDEVAIYNRALSANEIYTHYQAGRYGMLGEAFLNLSLGAGDKVNWTAQITPINSEAEGMSINTSIMILGDPPNNVTAIINSTNVLQTNLTNENLQVRFNVSDPDTGDTLNYSIQWMKNNVTQFTFTNLPVSNPGTAIQTLQHQNTTKGETWRAQVLVCDNNNLCNSFANTSELLILNTRPNATQNLQPLNNSIIKTLNPKLNWTNSSDLDNDNLTYVLDISNDSTFINIVYAGSGNGIIINYTGTPGFIGGFSATSAQASPNPEGVTTNGSDFWFIDRSGVDYVYHFDAFGNNITGAEGLIGGFSTRKAFFVSTLNNIDPTGITTNGSDFWVSDVKADYVYHFDAFGNNITGAEGLVGGWSLTKAQASINAQGITTNGSDFWIVDNNADYVYHFDAFGNNITGAEGLIGGFSAKKAYSSIVPKDITTNGSDFWIVDDNDFVEPPTNIQRNYIYHFDAFGNNVSIGEIGFDSGIAYGFINPNGIDTDARINYISKNGKSVISRQFWVTDTAADFIYHFLRTIEEQGIQGNRTQHNVTMNLRDGNYYFRVRAYDGSSYSDYVYGNFTIDTTNKAPTFTAFINTTDITKNDTNVNLTVNWINITDAENDTNLFNITANWFENNKSLLLLNLPFDYNATIGERTIKDYSGYEINFSIYGYGNITHNITNCKVGGCYMFNGGYGFINFSNNTNGGVYEFPTRQPYNFTLEFWAKINRLPSGTIILAGDGRATDTDVVYGIMLDNTGKLIAQVFTETPGQDPCNSGCVNDTTYPAFTGIWQHYAITFDSINLTLYINGTRVNTTRTPSGSRIKYNHLIYNPVFDIGVGGTGGVVNRWLNGSIDEVRLWNRTLSPEQIHRNYLLGIANKTIDTLVSSETTTNFTYKAMLAVTDTYNIGNFTNTSELLIKDTIVINSPPNNVTAIINSTNVLQTNLTNENLQVRFNVSDPDTGDTLNYSIQWMKNNVTQFTFTNLPVSNPGTAIQTLQHQNTTKGETWRAQVLVCDNNNLCNSFANTSELLILNSNITFAQGYPQINSTDGNNLSNKNLSVTWLATDNDAGEGSEILRYNLTVFTNNLTNFTINERTFTNGSLVIDIIDYRNLTKGQTWKAMITAYDTDKAIYANTSELLILNTAPAFQVNPVINSTNGLNTTEQNLNVFFTPNETDVNDRINYSVMVFKNNITNFSLHNIATTNGTFTNFVIDNRNTTKGETWKAQVWITDGTSNSTLVNTSEILILNTAPAFQVNPVINSTNGLNTTEQDLNVFFTPNDTDGDSLVYSIEYFRNNISNFILPNISATNNAITINTLNNKNTTKGETWKAQVGLMNLVPTSFNNGPDDGTSFVSESTGEVAGEAAWNTPENAQTSDDSYADVDLSSWSIPSNSAYLKATGFNFNIPSTATIKGILVEVERRDKESDHSTDIKDYKASIVQGYAVAGDDKADTSTSWPTTDEYKSYGGASDLWGLTWAPRDINDAGFGFAISAQAIGTGNEIAMIDHIQITVYYTELEGDNIYIYSNTSELLILNSNITFAQGYPQINSTDGNNLSNKNLSVTWLATDNDAGEGSEILRYNLTVFTNNLTNFTINERTFTNGSLVIDIIDYRNLTKGQTWKAMITAYDTDKAIYANTSELLILNTAPSKPLLNAPVNNTYFNTSTPEFFINNSDDIDNDQIYYILEIDDSFSFNSIDYYNGTIRKITNGTNSHNLTSSLTDNIYYWRARATDLESNSSYTEIRNFTIDTTLPISIFVSPTEANNSYLNRDYIIVNVTVTETNFANVTFYFANSTTVNITTFTTLINGESRIINYSNLNQNEVYKYNISVTDLANNVNYSETRTLTLDSIFPVIDFAAQTPINNSYLNYSQIFVNWTYTEINLANITFRLFNLTGNANTTIFNTTTYQINITGIKDTIYTYNVTIIDLANKKNETETRTLTLDTTYPTNLTLLSPENNNISLNRTPLFTWSNITEINFANYTLEIDDDSDISSPQFTFVFTGNVTNSSFQMTQLLNDNTNYYWRVTATDLANNRNSSTFKYTTLSTGGPTPSTPSGGGGGGGGGTRVVRAADIELIRPGELVIYPNDVIVVPIYVRNTGGVTLNSIFLEATTENANLTLSLDKTFITILGPDQEDISTLTITSLTGAATGQYEVKITALVSNPPLTDTARILISLIGEDTGSKGRAEKQVAFAQKLFDANPECLELRELLTQAEQAINNKEYEKALSLSDAAIQACKDLVSSKGERLKIPTQLNVSDTVVLILELIVFSFLAYGMYYYYKRRRLKKKLRK